MKIEPLLKRLFRYREIQHTDGRPYLDRYFILFKKRPAWAPFNIFLHRFHSSDDDRAYHDHPWTWWGSFILCGGYWEHKSQPKPHQEWHGALSFRVNKPHTLHRLSLDKEKAQSETWTLFFVGKRFRDWGFSETGNDWTDYRKYLSLPDDYKPSID